jgi:hypothetical protein
MEAKACTLLVALTDHAIMQVSRDTVCFHCGETVSSARGGLRPTTRRRHACPCKVRAFRQQALGRRLWLRLEFK